MVAPAASRHPGSRILIERGNFPTDRFVVEGIAQSRALTVDWLYGDPVNGVAPEEVEAAVTDETALVVLSHVDYRSGALADMPTITRIVKSAGAVMLWDLCHSVGVVPMQLDAWDVDMAVGCTYKYLNGGPGSPAFAYVRRELHERVEQPIWGWMGASDVFDMGPTYRPAEGIRRFLSGTPPVLGMLAIERMLDLLEDATIARVRAKSMTLTQLAIAAHGQLLAPKRVELLSPRDAERRGSHVTVKHPSFRELTARLWAEGIIPDFRSPDSIRIGLSPLSTSHAETLRGLQAIAGAL